jgi:hypothetical protein
MPLSSGFIEGYITENNRGVRVRGVNAYTNGNAACIDGASDPEASELGYYFCSDTEGTYTFTFARTGYTTKNVQIEIIGSQVNRHDIQIWRVNPLGNIIGRITDPTTGNGVANAKVTSNAPDDNPVYSDAEGDYNYPCLEGTWTLTFEKAGYTTRSISGIQSVPSQNTTRNLNLYQVAHLQGYVKRSTNQVAIEGAKIVPTDGSASGEEYSNASGFYKTTNEVGQSGSVTFTVTKSGYVTQNYTTTLNAGQTEIKQFNLVPV